MDDWTITGETDNPFFVRITMAGRINRLAGLNIGPWDIDAIDPQWLIAFRVLDKYEVRAQKNAMVQAHFKKAMSDHPTFRKH